MFTLGGGAAPAPAPRQRVIVLQSCVLLSALVIFHFRLLTIAFRTRNPPYLIILSQTIPKQFKTCTVEKFASKKEL